MGAADEGAEAGGEAEEGPGAAVQPAAHRIQPDALRDADAGHSSSQVPASQSHGESRWLQLALRLRGRVQLLLEQQKSG